MRAYIAAPNSSTTSAEERPIPVPGPDEVLVRVSAIALNNGDTKPVEMPQVLGFEFAGEIAATSAAGLAVGTRVMGIAEGAAAEYVVAHRRHLLEMPDGISAAEAAALPTALSTEYGALRRAGIAQGDTVLITAATAGIALQAIAIAHTLGASSVIGTTRRDEAADLVRRAGADHVIVTGRQDLVEAARQLTDGTGVDIVLDHIAGDALGQAVQAARMSGTVISVGRLAARTAQLDLFELARRQVTVASVSYGLNPPEIIGDLFDGVTTDLLPAVADHRIRAVLDGVWHIDRLDEALNRLREGKAQGKIVLTLH